MFWETLQLIGSWYVTRGLRHASPTYGVFAVVITLLSWLYLGSPIFRSVAGVRKRAAPDAVFCDLATFGRMMSS